MKRKRSIEEIRRQMEDNKAVGLPGETVVHVTLEEMLDIFDAMNAEVVD